MTLKEAFEILEVDETMDSTAIRRAYRDLAIVWHPDKYFHNQRLAEKASDKLKKINNAYDVIKKSTVFKSEQSTQGESRKSQQQDYPGKDGSQSKKDNTHAIVRCVNCGTKNRVPQNRWEDRTIKCGRCKNSLLTKHKKSQDYQQRDRQDKNDSQPDKDELHVFVHCVNCGVINKIPKNRSGQSSIKCGSCGNSLYARYKKPENNQRDSSECVSSISVRCINCGNNNIIPKSKSYNPSAMCGSCGNSIYLKNLSSETANASYKKFSHDLDKKLDDIYKKHFDDIRKKSA